MASYFRRIFSRMADSAGALSRPVGQQVNVPNAYDVSAASSVTIDTSLQLSAVWACVKILAESLASLPLKFYTVDSDGAWTEKRDYPLAILFGRKVNTWQNRMEFFETMMASAVLRGNCYALKQYNASGMLIGLQPMVADQMDVVLLEDGTVTYQYRDGPHLKVYSASKIWHVRGVGNGLMGFAPLDYMRNSVGIGQAAENSVTRMYKNGGKPGGILSIDHVLKADQRAAIKKSFAELAEGTQDALLVLEADMKYQQVKLTPLDMELLATRKFQIEDICRFFGVPPVLIGYSGDGSVWGSGFSQILHGFYKVALRPYLERFEISVETSLMPIGDQGKIECEFDADAFLRLSEPELVTMLKEAVTGALLSPNEARKRLGEKPVEGGGTVFLQQQMFPIDKLAHPDRTFSPGIGERVTDVPSSTPAPTAAPKA